MSDSSLFPPSHTLICWMDALWRLSRGNGPEVATAYPTTRLPLRLDVARKIYNDGPDGFSRSYTRENYTLHLLLDYIITLLVEIFLLVPAVAAPIPSCRLGNDRACPSHDRTFCSWAAGIPPNANFISPPIFPKDMCHRFKITMHTEMET